MDIFANGIVKVGVIVALGLVILASFLNLSIGTTASNAAINATIGGIDDIPGWIPLLVVAFMGTIALTFMGSFGGRGR